MQESQMADGEILDAPHDAAQHSISPEQTEFTNFAPPAELAPYVTQIYYFSCEQAFIQDRQPAALGHLIFLLGGSGSLRFHDGHIDRLAPASIFGPGMAAAEFTIDGPLHDLGFALSPLGFVALTGKPANLYVDRAVPAAELFGAEIDALAHECIMGRADGSMRIAAMIAKISAFLLARIHNVPPAHITMIQAVINWLSSDLDPDVEVLYPQLGMSRSTAARLISRYFGSPPKQLMRKYRALRAASILVDPNCTPDLRTKIESLFYDQPHMIREIRQFAGRTPGALDSDDAKILRIWLSKDNYRDIETFPG